MDGCFRATKQQFSHPPLLADKFFSAVTVALKQKFDFPHMLTTLRVPYQQASLLLPRDMTPPARPLYGS